MALAHALLLAIAPPRPATPRTRPALQARLIEAPPSALHTAAASATAGSAAPATDAVARAVPVSRPTQRLTPTPAARAPARPSAHAVLAKAAGEAPGARPPPPVAAGPAPATFTAPPAPAPPLPAAHDLLLGAAAATTTLPAPVRLARAATLDYRVSGTARGLPFETEAQLLWQRDGSRYAADWTVQRLPPLGERAQRSEGAVTAAGLAPERYAERARGERAAHFDPAGGRIRFSANTPDATLPPGAQDRLSAALQLGGLIAAAPERYPPGSSVTLHTAGVRDADAWRWEVLADETLPIDGEDVPCTKLVRPPRGDHDSRVELWLARPFDYLPARLRVTQAGGDSVDQQLRAPPRR